VSAFAGDEQSVRETLGYLDEIGCPTSEMAGLAAQAFWLHGRCALAREILDAWPERAEDSLEVVFRRAAARQLVGDTEAAGTLVQRLCSRSFMQSQTKTDAPWVWGAVVMKNAGCRSEAELLLTHAMSVTDGGRALYDDVPLGRSVLAGGWRELYAKVLVFGGGRETGER
jgi:hypothetical protein